MALDQTSVVERSFPAVPVFVDESGRKSRRTRRVARAVRICLLVYFSLVVASFAGVSLVPRLSLPGLGNLLPPTAAPGLPPLDANALSTPTADLGTASQPARGDARLAPPAESGTTPGASFNARAGVPAGILPPQQQGQSSPGSAGVGTSSPAAPPSTGASPVQRGGDSTPPGLSRGPASTAPPATGIPGNARAQGGSSDDDAKTPTR
ncbi:MAG: hypothetical protein H0U41_02930 [Actinobacteria bacterium]|nr:hypothetical protein [Actinomycetota bacterium]